ncbi:hypothetical protein BKA62DRAFT_94890 [Auriculariales sp. MPI-PUGE-AT-0066]|nr:hypothetical protein BKA62DRAFT_94890 [Auriculariales sp. MPI-PUGE-AT-0066]
MFEIARRLQQSEDATDHMAGLSQFLYNRVRGCLILRGELYVTAHEHIVDGFLNLLLPRPLDVTSRPSTSVWAIISQFRMSLLYPSNWLAIELARRAQLMTNDSTDISLTDLLHELAGNDYGTKLAIQDTSVFAHFARHGRVVSEDWWQEAKKLVLELSEDEWSARTDKSRHSTPQQLVDEIDTATRCCGYCKIELPRVNAARAAEFSTTASPRATPVDQDRPAPSPPPPAHSATREPMNIARRTNTLSGTVVRRMRDTFRRATEGEDGEMRSIHETGPAAV